MLPSRKRVPTTANVVQRLVLWATTANVVQRLVLWATTANVV